jgi:hypothetical protein
MNLLMGEGRKGLPCQHPGALSSPPLALGFCLVVPMTDLTPHFWLHHILLTYTQRQTEYTATLLE